MEEYDLIYETETDLAIGVRTGGSDELIWLPKSQIEYDDAYYTKGVQILVYIPDWLAIEKELA